MISRDEFIQRRGPTWTAVMEMLRTESPRSASTWSRLASLYRELCGDLMHARAAGFGADLIGHLDQLSARTHTELYGRSSRAWMFNPRLIWHDFPRHLRESWPFMLAATLLFAGPLVLAWSRTLLDPSFAERILSAQQLVEMSEMYAESTSSGRSTGTNLAMTGFYVWNNISIAFRCFATGIFFGLGPLIFLVFNGLTIGATLGHVTQSGHGENILTFICGHAAFELGAIIVAGAAGLRLGYALIATQTLSRVESLRRHALGCVPLVMGATAMLSVAALVEGLWSPSQAPYPIKWAVGGLNTILVASFWLFAARKAR